MTEKQKKNTKQFTCKFHGDLVLDEHPGNYEEAVRVYKRLPELLGENYENSVPMTVSLYPLDALPINKESEIVHEIRSSYSILYFLHKTLVKRTRDMKNPSPNTYSSPHHSSNLALSLTLMKLLRVQNVLLSFARTLLF